MLAVTLLWGVLVSAFFFFLSSFCFLLSSFMKILRLWGVLIYEAPKAKLGYIRALDVVRVDFFYEVFRYEMHWVGSTFKVNVHFIQPV